MNYPKVLNQFPSQAGKPFRPSNGTEGMMFTSCFCDVCFHDRNQDCNIYAATMAFDLNDEEYPKEWVYSEEGWPICTKFQKWDGSDPAEPKPEVPDDPDQLCINFHFDEILEELELA